MNAPFSFYGCLPIRPSRRPWSICVLPGLSPSAAAGTGRTVHPKRVEFQRPESHRKMYESHFQCPVKFGARHNVLVFKKADLDQPFLTHNADLLALVAPQLEAELTQHLAQKKLKEQVKGVLKKLL